MIDATRVGFDKEQKDIECPIDVQLLDSTGTSVYEVGGTRDSAENG